MQLTGFDSFSGLRDAALRNVSSVSGVVRACLERLAPLRDRLAEEVRKQPKIAAGLDGVSGVWTKLVESFCEMISPLVSRYFPATRLVAVMTPSGDVALHAIGRDGTVALGLLGSIDATKRSEIANSKWIAIELRLRPDQLLERSLSLPTASRDFLGPIIEHKLERLTPWRPDRVMYGYRVLPNAEAGGGVTVLMTATSRDFVAAPVQALEEAGLKLTAIGSEQETLSEPLSLNLLRDTTRAASTNSGRIVSRGALAVFGLLAITWVASSYWASSAADGQREASVRLAKARRLLKTASMGAVGDRERILLESKQPDRTMVVLINKLAAAIPDDTYLKEFVVTPDKVRLVGTSGNSPALIGKLESMGLFHVRFASAVTREKNQSDNFEITADQADIERRGTR